MTENWLMSESKKSITIKFIETHTKKQNVVL